jgi:Ca2+/H+ antiporter, TMEM165/GDT1 family
LLPALEAFVTSTVVVTLAEMGDKTQLLALCLTSRFRQPWTVLLGILIATVLNHTLAALAGGWITAHISPVLMTWILGLSFIGFGCWTLIPDTYDEDENQPSTYGPLLTTIMLFFLAEMGDKTQLATVALGAKYVSTVTVVMGTTLGMLIADGLAVFLGAKLETLLPLNLLRNIAAGLFIVLGLVTLGTLLIPA